jgi:hypothetical protein
MNLTQLKAQIEGMPKYHQVQILQLFNSLVPQALNENKNGTFINLSELETAVIEKIEQYVKYVQEQQQNLKHVETEKTRLQQQFFGLAAPAKLN